MGPLSAHLLERWRAMVNRDSRNRADVDRAVATGASWIAGDLRSIIAIIDKFIELADPGTERLWGLRSAKDAATSALETAEHLVQITARGGGAPQARND